MPDRCAAQTDVGSLWNGRCWTSANYRQHWRICNDALRLDPNVGLNNPDGKNASEKLTGISSAETNSNGTVDRLPTREGTGVPQHLRRAR